MGLCGYLDGPEDASPPHLDSETLRSTRNPLNCPCAPAVSASLSRERQAAAPSVASPDVLGNTLNKEANEKDTEPASSRIVIYTRTDGDMFSCVT